MSKNKHILIFPPLSSCKGIHMAVPSLCGQLRKSGYDAERFDYNIDFITDILKYETIEKSLEKSVKVYNELKENKEKFYKKNDSIENELLTEKYNILEKFFSNKNIKDEIKNKLKYIDKAIEVMKSDDFYDNKKFFIADNLIKLFLKVISIPYSPIKIMNMENIDFFRPLSYEYLKYIVTDKRFNIFYEYYQKNLEDIISKKPAFVGVSICYPSQILAGLTICYLLKKRTKAHITIGGGTFNRKNGLLKEYPDFFNQFVDSFLYGEGEYSIIDLAEYLNKERKLKDVHNIIYKTRNKVVANERYSNFSFSNIALPDFSDVDFNKYLSPVNMLPIEIHRGCYWGKCSFCDFNFQQSFSHKNLDTVIKQIKFYKEEYGISNIVIIDSAMPPAFLDKFSDELLKNKLDIKFIMDARLEANYTYDLLKKASDAGLRCVGWGVESVNPRISKLINKGIDIKKGVEILKNSDKAGIWNTVYMFIGFPTETEEEALETINFIKENRDIIHTVCLSKFVLLPNSPIYKDYKKYGISKIISKKGFDVLERYETSSGMTRKEVDQIHHDFQKYKNYFYESVIHDCSFLLNARYLFKYSLNEIKQMYNNLHKTDKQISR